MKYRLLLLICSCVLTFSGSELIAQRRYNSDYQYQGRYEQRDQSRYEQREYAPRQYERNDYAPRDRFVGYRMASRYNENSPKSVLNSEYYPENETRLPEPNHNPPQHQYHGSNPTLNHDLGHQRWQEYPSHSNCDSCLGSSGHIPFVTGDIFGVSRFELCDEWEGHCECLQLTSVHDNCECTNPRRAHWGSGSRSCSSGSCGSCSGCTSDYGYSRSASRTPVSDYFHPRRR